MSYYAQEEEDAEFLLQRIMEVELELSYSISWKHQETTEVCVKELRALTHLCEHRDANVYRELMNSPDSFGYEPAIRRMQTWGPYKEELD